MFKRILLIVLMLFVPAWGWTALNAQVWHDTQPPAPTDSMPSRPRYKAQGYRIQIYCGINGRKSRAEAKRMGEMAQSLFPELSVYCHYKQPRWVCCVGDFPTREAAQHHLQAMRRSTFFPQCHIVKSQVLLPLSTLTLPEDHDRESY
ncbi:MAG: SPOR domain-containing protein [Bacteroidaceae bacterium]|nr:SPOR domain-containing protein [Bacteroidaceae bacterium]